MKREKVVLPPRRFPWKRLMITLGVFQNTNPE